MLPALFQQYGAAGPELAEAIVNQPHDTQRLWEMEYTMPVAAWEAMV